MVMEDPYYKFLFISFYPRFFSDDSTMFYLIDTSILKSFSHKTLLDLTLEEFYYCFWNGILKFNNLNGFSHLLSPSLCLTVR